VPRHRVIKAVAITVAAVLVVVLTGGFFVYRHLNNNITGIDITSALGTDRPTEVKAKTPQKPLNILLLGSDTRQGQTGHIGGDTPGLSDTTILLHISGDRKLAYGVSLPRDAMVERPSCERKDGQGTDPGGLSMFNAAYAVGGPSLPNDSFIPAAAPLMHSRLLLSQWFVRSTPLANLLATY